MTHLQVQLSKGEGMTEDKIFNILNELKDEKFKAFTSKLIPNISPDNILGIQTPKLRSLARVLKNDANIGVFLSTLPHRYLEENSLHAYIIEQINDYNRCIEEVDRFLPYIDNWGTCDGLRPKCFKKHTDKLIAEVQRWLESGKTYKVRFAIGMLMSYYLDEHFKLEYLEMVARIETDEYYVKMMIAWYFATALAKQYDSAIGYIERKDLKKWIHNKTIQKAVESYRITSEQKAYLRTLKQ